MNNFSRPRFAQVSWASTLLLTLALSDVACAQAPKHFTVDRRVPFVAGTDKTRAQLGRIPAAREIAAENFAIAKVDLDDDGQPELILLANSPALCRDGGCALLILQKSVNGIETLLATKVSRELALTTERVDGYRALAALDGTGRIALGDRPETTRYGKQLVYLMRSRAPTPAETTAAIAASGKGSANAGVKSASMDLVEFIGMFMQPQAEAAALGDWTLGAAQGSPFRWKTTGIQQTSSEQQRAGYPYHRDGELVLTVEGKPTHQLPKRPGLAGRWTISLLGPRGGFTRVSLSAAMADGSGPLLEGQRATLPLRHYRCKPQYASSGNRVFVVQGPGKKPLWVNEEWSCGSAGCGLSLDIVFTKKEADAFECF